VCNNSTSVDPCEICSAPERDGEKICVVEEPFNIHSIERTGLFHGHYHVLMGNLSPMRGIGPDELRIAGLLERVKKGNFREVILATSPTTEGSATAHYLTEILRQYKITISRIALGLPVGADLDYADEVTIAKAIEGRLEVK
jgi:recombination protein RecR